MVSYTEWFEVVHEAAPDGLSRQRRGNLTSDLAEYWQANKSDLRAMSKAEARQLAAKIVTA